jgi:hypothetical protein
MSGEVDESTAQAAGRMVGAETIILGSFTGLTNMHRLTVKALAVETAEVQGMFNKVISGSSAIKGLSARTTKSGAGLYSNGKFEGALGLVESVNWIRLNGVNNGNYVIVLGRDEAAPPVNLSFGSRRISVTLKSEGEERSVSYDTPSRPSASLFTIGTGVTFNLEDGIALVGLAVDSRPLVKVKGGVFVMNGGSIRDNSLSVYMKYTDNSFGNLSWDKGEIEGGGVLLESGNFILNNGIIKGNSAQIGGGISIGENGILIINGGAVSGNSVQEKGGGVYSTGSFTMRGGIISDNSSSVNFWDNYGGGVAVNGKSFNMENGVISGNSSSWYGGGIGIEKGNFYMRGGSISGNLAIFGCGVYCNSSDGARFIKSGGIIYGTEATKSLANRVYGNYAGMGYAVFNYVGNSLAWERNTTAGKDCSMDSDNYWRFGNSWEGESSTH